MDLNRSSQPSPTSSNRNGFDEADMPRPPGACRFDENDPQQTLAGLKSRSAAVLCYPFRPKHGSMAVKRREFITLLVGAAWPLAARAQQRAMPVIGFLHSETLDAISGQVAAFRRALNEAGYTEGQNLAIEFRWAEGRFDRVPALLADLIQHKVAVLVAGGGTVQAVKAAGTGIPTVFTTGGDPVQQGLVPSLNRPGGNMTGVAFFVIALGPKELEMLLAAVPAAKVIGFVSNTGYPYANAQISELEAAVRPLGRTLVVQNIGNDGEIETAFAALSRKSVEALIVGGDPFFYRWRKQMVTQAARYALPACYGQREFAMAGGLMSYGADLSEAYRQVGLYAARLLKGQKPADLPVVQAVKVELVLNLKTAKALGLTFPLTLLGRADEVIE
jgi:putative tryptophan/tyrosine transport system substrate-binding protein